jgi:hypothetical protein
VVPASFADILRTGTLAPPRWLDRRPAGGFYADPFPIAFDGRTLRLLAEHYRYNVGRAHLAELAVDLSGHVVHVRPALAPRRHLSYPFLLRHAGETFCIPESHSAGALDAYRLDRSTGAWHFHARLLDAPAVDPTLVQHAGRWWLFCTLPRDDARLYLFHAPNWHGPWAPHAGNPVKVDPSSSRPAGHVQVVDGAPYRPAQDCSVRYGGALAINRVVRLDEHSFAEETVLRLAPDPAGPWPLGLHTLNSLGDITLVDGLRVEHSARHLLRRALSTRRTSTARPD